VKKMAVFLAVVVSLALLPGSSGEKRRPEDPQCQWVYQAWRQNIDEYAIVRASDPDKLQKEVNKRLKESWHPVGGISIVDSNCCQVMIR